MRCPLCSTQNTKYFASKDTYRFYRCTLCKTIFLSHLPSPTFLNAYYAKSFSYKDGLLNEAVIRKRSHIIIKNLKKIIPEAASLCDVGSGYGFFIDEAKKAGYQVNGIEPSHKLALHGIKHYGVHTFTGDLNAFLLKNPTQFDVVTCIHVIEHVSNPHQFIKQLMRLVKSGGILFLETPNSDSHLLYVEKENYTFLIPPDHLWLFSRFSIQKILPKNTEIFLTRTYSYSEHFMGIVKKILGRNIKTNNKTNNKTNTKTNTYTQSKSTIKQKLFYYLFDCFLAPIFTGTLNLYHKGSILELYIRKEKGKCGL